MDYRVLVGYRPMPDEARCPHCGDAHGMIESTDTPGRYRYTCWCGAKCTLTATIPELVDLGVSEERIAEAGLRSLGL